jgi:hypothetical protein
LRRRADRFGLDIILIDVWEGAGAAEEALGYCARWGLEGTVLLDETAEYARRLGVRGVPTNVFVDFNGIVTGFGASRFEDLLDEARTLEARLDDDERLMGADRAPADFERDGSQAP